MKNTWLDEAKVCKMAKKISHSLVFKFVGTKTDLSDWGKHTFEMMKDLEPRIRDSLMWKYIFQSEEDGEGRITYLEFVKLPWLV